MADCVWHESLFRMKLPKGGREKGSNTKPPLPWMAENYRLAEGCRPKESEKAFLRRSDLVTREGQPALLCTVLSK